MDSAFFSYTPRFGDSSDWGVIAIPLTMPDHVLSWTVGYTEVIIMPISDKTANQIATLFHCYSSQE